MELRDNGVGTQEQEPPLLKHSSVSVAPVAANEKGASWSIWGSQNYRTVT